MRSWVVCIRKLRRNYCMKRMSTSAHLRRTHYRNSLFAGRVLEVELPELPTIWCWHLKFQIDFGYANPSGTGKTCNILSMYLFIWVLKFYEAYTQFEQSSSLWFYGDNMIFVCFVIIISGWIWQCCAPFTMLIAMAITTEGGEAYERAAIRALLKYQK